MQSADEIAQRPGAIFYRDGGHHRISGGVDNRDVTTEFVGEINASAIRTYCHTVREGPNCDGGHNRIAGSVDHRDAVILIVGDIGAGAIRSDRYAIRDAPYADGCHHGIT